MVRVLGLPLILVALFAASHAHATVLPCFHLAAKPAPASIEPGETALRLTVPRGIASTDFAFGLFDPSGRKLPVALAADDSFGRDWSNGSFWVTSTERIQPGVYAIEYMHECIGTSRRSIEFVQAGALPAVLGELSVEQSRYCPSEQAVRDFPPPVFVTLSFDAAVLPYAPLMRLRITDDLGNLHWFARDLSEANIEPLDVRVPACSASGAVPPGERTITVSAELADGTALAPLSRTLSVQCPDCPLPPALDAGAAPGPPGLPDPPDPTEPPKPGKGKDDGCECRAVMRAGAPLPGGLLLLLALGGALSRRRARRAPRFSTD